MDDYTYLPLPTPHHTRILILHPALDHTAPLHCSIILMDPESKEPYEALSYIWGSTEAMSSLLCEGKSIHITHNCDSALRHLRHTIKDIILWVDSICIDQKNLEKRAQQVMIMGKIYKQAEKVAIWLGAGSKEIEESFGRINKALERDSSFVSDNKTYLDLTRGISVFDSLYVYHNQWSSRMWSVQEFIYASHLMVQCGNSKGSWESYKILSDAATVNLMLRHGQRVFEANKGSMQLYIRDKFKETLTNIDEAKLDLILASTADVIQQNDCSDDRGRIYGLYYVLKSKLKDIPAVDYSKSAEIVYSEFVLATIRSAGRFWSTLLMRPTLDMGSEAPSWIPDFKYQYRNINLTSFVSRYMRIEKSATNYSQMDMKSVEISTPTMLVIKGIFVASILNSRHL